MSLAVDDERGAFLGLPQFKAAQAAGECQLARRSGLLWLGQELGLAQLLAPEEDRCCVGPNWIGDPLVLQHAEEDGAQPIPAS